MWLDDIWIWTRLVKPLPAPAATREERHCIAVEALGFVAAGHHGGWVLGAGRALDPFQQPVAEPKQTPC